MAFQARDVKMAYNFNTAVPSTNVNYQYFQDFKEKFGEDGNILVLGVKDSALYQVDNFNSYRILSLEIQKTDGISNVISLGNLQEIIKNPTDRSFELKDLIEEEPKTQRELELLLEKVVDLKFYTGQLLNPENGATLILINMDREVLNSSKRNDLVDLIRDIGTSFTEDTGIELHYSGMPFVRTVMQQKQIKS